MERDTNENRLHQIVRSLNPVDYVQRVLAHRALAIAVIAALTLFFAAFIPRLAFKTSIHDLIIEDLPENIHYEAFKAVFGSEEIIRVVVKCKNVFDPLNFQRIAQLEATARKIEGVQRVRPIHLDQTHRADVSNVQSLHHVYPPRPFSPPAS